MINKKYILAIIIAIVIISFGFIKINIINTKALSPIGNAEENYEKIIKEFGEEFEEFIKDGSYIKIYTDKDLEERTVIKLGKTEVFIKDNNIVIDKIKEYYTYFITGYQVVKDNALNKMASFKKEEKVIEEEEAINVNSELNEEKKEIKSEEKKEIKNEKNTQNKLDKIVEDFIKNKE